MEIQTFKAICQDPSSDQLFINEFINHPLTSISIIISNINFQPNLLTETERIQRQTGFIILKRTIENFKKSNPEEIEIRDDLLKTLLIINQNLIHQTEVDSTLINELNEIISELIKLQCLTHDLIDLDFILNEYNVNLLTIYCILKSISSLSNLRSKLIIKRYSHKHFLEFFEKYQTQQEISITFEIISILSIESFEEIQLQELIKIFQSDLLSITLNSTNLNEELILQYSNFFLTSNQINQEIINTYSNIIQHPQSSKPILIKSCEIILQALDSWTSLNSIKLSNDQLYNWINLIISLFSVDSEEEEHSILSNLFECFCKSYQVSCLILIQNLLSETQQQLSIKLFTFGLWIGSIKKPIESNINLDLILNEQFNNLFLPIFQSINDHHLEEFVINNLAFTMRKILQTSQVSNSFRSKSQWILMNLYTMNSSYLNQLSTINQLIILSEDDLGIDWLKVLDCLLIQLEYELEAYNFLKTLITSDLSLMNGSTEKFCEMIIKTWKIELNETLKERLIDCFNELIITLESHELININFNFLIQIINQLIFKKVSLNLIQNSFQILIQSIQNTSNSIEFESIKFEILTTFSKLLNPSINLTCSLILLIPINDLFKIKGFLNLIQNLIQFEENQKNNEENDDNHNGENCFVLIRLILISSTKFDMNLLMNYKQEIFNLFNFLINSKKNEEKVYNLLADLCVLNLNVFLETLNHFPPMFYQTLFHQWKLLFNSTNLQINQKKIIKSFKVLGELKAYKDLMSLIRLDFEEEDIEEEDEKVNENENEWGELIGLGRFKSKEFHRLKSLKDYLKNQINLDCFEEIESNSKEYLISNSSCETFQDDQFMNFEDLSLSSNWNSFE